MSNWRDFELQEAVSFLAANELITVEDIRRLTLEKQNSPVLEIPTPFDAHGGEFSFRLGSVHLLGGYSGHGKTTLVMQIALYAMSRGYKVGMASMEMEAADIGPMLISMAGAVENPTSEYSERITRAIGDRLDYWDAIDNQSPEATIQFVIETAKRGCQLIVLDNLMMVGDITGESRDEKEFVAQLKVAAARYQVAILLCHHMRKPAQAGEEKPPGKQSFLGSSMMPNICATISVIHKNVGKAEAESSGFEYDDNESDYTYRVLKNRFGPYHGMIPLWAHPSRLFCPGSSRRVRAMWDV